jgi:hypothetical protein
MLQQSQLGKDMRMTRTELDGVADVFVPLKPTQKQQTKTIPAVVNLAVLGGFLQDSEAELITWSDKRKPPRRRSRLPLATGRERWRPAPVFLWDRLLDTAHTEREREKRWSEMGRHKACRGPTT